MGALQLGAVLSEPLPKARRGGKIEGARHEQGGVLVETEGEERIVAARPAKAFPELLNLISYIGKNAGVPDTGYALRRAEAERAAAGGGGTTLEIDYDRLGEVVAQHAAAGGGGTTLEIDYDRLGEVVAQRVGEEIKNLQVWLSLTELRDAQDNVVHMDELTRQ
jgi:hypothetical protein